MGLKEISIGVGGGIFFGSVTLIGGEVAFEAAKMTAASPDQYDFQTRQDSQKLVDLAQNLPDLKSTQSYRNAIQVIQSHNSVLAARDGYIQNRYGSNPIYFILDSPSDETIVAIHKGLLGLAGTGVLIELTGLTISGINRFKNKRLGKNLTPVV